MSGILVYELSLPTTHRTQSSSRPMRGSVLLWDVTTGTSHTLIARSAGEIPLAFSPDSQIIALYVGREVEFWVVATGKLMQSLEVDYEVRAMQFYRMANALALGC
ncbi:Pc12g02760 [Penicillium rubens Wisconsin 54-1255]|uniref:Pc12g02760 protein n=1 Tax=Penicillium rubens (strain ATCC 28089 / DSM 1075 / NRRL 1951 / Wisconsin 54-1255) TaxID=500485 RepID=B6H0B8_PENRW|nr:uncharacterized protein N7525_002192 [Penicillium rubens]KAJ5844451.1 hypothetical protein N7525_002192 [Penicillium rubens]CAP79903.1 Pc12g02760 [Penicillium rubens Wisconsin 54-1255]